MLVKCKCNPEYGSDDCSVNLTIPPEFEVAETCCDTSTMNCEKIVGISNHLSNNNELTVELKLFQEDGTLDKESKFLGTANVVDPTRFELDFPFGFMPSIKQSQVTIMVGITYGKSAYFTQNMTFFDSKCRTCNNGVVDQSTVNK